MKVPPPDVDEPALVDHLATGWGHEVESIQFVPEGFGSYHWVATAVSGDRLFLTVDDLDAKPWLGHDRGTVFMSLQACFAAAVALRAEVGLEFVLAPHPDRHGLAVRRIADRYSLSVFPFVPGHSGRWGEPLTPAVGEELVGLLSRLHERVPEAGGLPLRRGELPGREELEAALGDLAVRWGSGPFAEPARALFTANEDRIGRWLADYDRLGRAVADAAGYEHAVLTHGEPHPGNLLQTNHGLRLIDWDTVALAPRERDLWMLAGHPGLLARYTERTGRQPDAQCIDFYRLTWALQDLAAFIGVMRAVHEDNADTAKAWSGICDYLSEDRQVYPWA